MKRAVVILAIVAIGIAAYRVYQFQSVLNKI